MLPRLTALFLPLLLVTAALAQAAERPNIVIILADDLGWGDPRVFSPASKVPTPTLDRLATQGLRFTDAHTPSSVCTPTRYGLLTGRYAWRSALKKGVLNGYSPALIEPERATLASLCKARGYATAAIGKWHLGLGTAKRTDYSQPLTPGPNTVGFDSFFGIPASLDMPPYLYIRDTAPEQAPTGQVPDSKRASEGGAGFWRGGPAAPDFKHNQVLGRLTKEAISFLESRADKTKTQPFFLYVPLTAPHTPWQPLPPFVGKSGAGPYGDFVAQVDGAIGEVFETMDRLGLTKDTLVIVTSDNGAPWRPEDIEEFGHRANGPWRGQKADIHEAGHRVAFFARWPGRIPAGTTSSQTICLTDVFATVARVIGAKVPRGAGEDSFDLSAVMRTPSIKKPVRSSIVHHSGDGMFAIRSGNWKLIAGLGSGGFTAPKFIEPKPGEPAGQLYDLAKDPAETDNVYAAHPDVAKRLSGLLKTQQDSGHSAPAR